MKKQKAFVAQYVEVDLNKVMLRLKDHHSMKGHPIYLVSKYPAIHKLSNLRMWTKSKYVQKFQKSTLNSII